MDDVESNTVDDDANNDDDTKKLPDKANNFANVVRTTMVSLLNSISSQF